MFSRDNPNPEDRSSFDSAANGNDTIKFRKASPVSGRGFSF
jgi:hypothetical protein